jgi:hypothetical protein
VEPEEKSAARVNIEARYALEAGRRIHCSVQNKRKRCGRLKRAKQRRDLRVDGHGLQPRYARWRRPRNIDCIPTAARDRASPAPISVAIAVVSVDAATRTSTLESRTVVARAPVD